MPVINAAPVTFTNYSLKIGADNYEKHVSAVTVTPETPVNVWKGAGAGQVVPTAGKTAWTIDIEFAQDWATANSLSIYLLNNSGTTKAIEFMPLGAGPKFTATALIIPSIAGGAIDETGTATVTLSVVDQVTFTPSAA